MRLRLFAQAVSAGTLCSCMAAASSHAVLGSVETEQVAAVKRFLVFERHAGPADTSSSSVWRAQVTGKRQVRLTRGERPLISPDGRWIVFLRNGQSGPDSQLWLISSTGGRSTLLRQADGKAARIGAVQWLSDSARLLVVESSGRFLIDRRTRAVTQIPPGNSGWSGPATFSPDGSMMAFTVADNTGSDIYSMPLTGGSPTRITFDHMSSEPVWGPTGEIAFYRGRSDGDIWLMVPDGSQVRQLTKARAGIVPFAWSSDGRRLLAINPPVRNGRLWAVDVRAGLVHARTRPSPDLFARGFSHDGKLILAGFACGTLGGRGDLKAVPFGVGRRTTVLVRRACYGSWSA
jgi:dipeptidyl aminopeptidase/acylaminoacyl peptidase